MTILLTLLACATQGNGVETTDSREVGDFSGVRNTTFVGVHWSAGEAAAEVHCDENLLEYISTDMEDGQLVIRTPNDMLLTTRMDCHVMLQSECLSRVAVSGSGGFVAQDGCELRELSVSGSGSADIGAIASDSLDIQVSGSGGVQVDQVDTLLLSIYTSGSGSVSVQDIATDTLAVEHNSSGGSNLSGQAGELDLDTSGSGAMNASDLLSYGLVARISGSGSSSVEMDGPVQAKLTGSGSLTLTGNPGPVDADESGSGRVSY
ncbi:MAG: hypothetical protein ACI9VR_001072 [Cognaticolwellia sp.]|jgi:hypothetical protein